MQEKRRFPYVTVEQVGEGFEAVAGLELKSLLKGDLLLAGRMTLADKNLPSRLDPRVLHQARKAMLQAISSWPGSTTIELRMTSFPDLTHNARSRILVSILLRVRAATEDGAREEAIRRYLGLTPVLSAHMPEAEFVPVTDKRELNRHRHPFTPLHALSILRRRERLCLSAPLSTPAVGFEQSASRGQETGAVVDHVFPWVPSMDEWSRLMSMLLLQLDPVQVVVRIRPAARADETASRRESTVRTCEVFMAGAEKDHLPLSKQAGLIRDTALKHLTAIRDTAFSLGVFVFFSQPGEGGSLANVLGAAVTSPPLWGESQNPFEGGFRVKELGGEETLEADRFPEEDCFSTEEAACAFRLPSPPLEEQPGIPLRRSRTSLALLPPPDRMERGTIELGLNEHQGMTQPILLGPNDRMRHVFLIAQTGTGKSTLMGRMILQDIQAGRGVGVIDPHGELVEELRGKIPQERAEDIILFDPLDKERPLGFNLIEWRTPEERDLIIDEIYQNLDRIYDMRTTGGPIFERNLRGMLRLLMGDKPRDGFVPTMLEFTLCYLSREFRDWLKEGIEDGQTMDFVKELERTGGDASLHNVAPYITSKFGRYVHDVTLARIVGQEKTSFDFEKIMNEGKILLVKLGKGRYGASVSALLANQIVARFKMAAMKRGEMRPHDRRDFFLYVDECHNLPQENFMELLAEARKYRMGLILATQYTAQLTSKESRADSLLAAILGNVGTTLILRLGQEDAAKLSPALEPQFAGIDVIGLPNYKGYARMQVTSEAIPPFSFTSEMDKTPYDPEKAAAIRERSRMKYGMDWKEVDAQIERRRTMWKQDKE